MDIKKIEVSREDRDVLVELNRLRKTLNALLTPENLNKLVDLKEELGGEDSSCMLERYEWFLTQSEFKEDCTYTRTSKRLFLYDHCDKVVELVKWIYENFAKDL